MTNVLGNASIAIAGVEYRSPEVFDAECRTIHRKAWWCAGHVSEWPLPGSFRRMELFGESILLVRDRAGAINGMVNLCQHRGAQLCTDSSGRAAGVLRCPYHGWTYRLDGRVLGVPSKNTFEGADPTARRLPPVHTQEWLGFVWINLDVDAAPLGAHFQPLLDMRFGPGNDVLSRYRIDTLEVAHRIDYGVIPANWKLLWENFSECYHCPALHDGLCTAVPQFAAGYGTVTGPQGAGARLAPGYEAFSTDGRPTGTLLPGLDEDDRTAFYGALLWPSAQVVCVGDHVVVLSMVPESPAGTSVSCYWLYHPDAVATDGFDPARAVELFDTTNREDFDACARMQRGTH